MNEAQPLERSKIRTISRSSSTEAVNGMDWELGMLETLEGLEDSDGSQTANISRLPSMGHFETFPVPGATSVPIYEGSNTMPGPSRRSSVETLESLLFSTRSMSSASSIEDVYGGAQRLFNFLSEQEWLKRLSREATAKVTFDIFENNLRRSLIQFSVHLKEEATTPIMAKAAVAVRRIARNTANLVRQAFESGAKLSSDEEAGPGCLDNSNQLNRPSENRDDDADDDEDDLLEDKEEGEDLKDLELLLSKSVALQLLEENLQLFVHPDPVRRALFKIWPLAHPRHLPLAIKYDLEWEVPDFLRTCFAKGQELGKILTVTGEAINAQVQSCADYLAQTWPKIGPVLLKSLEHDLLSLGEEGKAKALLQEK
jgi:hypothetical protein